MEHILTIKPLVESDTTHPPPKPKILKVHKAGLAGLPDGLSKIDIFVMWRLNWDGKRWTKPPLQTTGRMASVTNPRHRTNLHDALYALQCHPDRFDGIGVVLTDDIPIVGIDSDHSRSVTTGAITAEAADLCRRFPLAYTEISPSGTGIRLLVPGTYVGTKNKVNLCDGQALEMYSNKRFLTLTGHRFQTAASLARNNPNHDYSTELQILHDEVLAPPLVTTNAGAGQQQKRPRGTQATGPRSDVAIVNGFAEGRNTWFQQAAEYFHHGVPEGADASKIEFHLTLAILRANDGDEAQADRIFRASAIYGDPERATKWDSQRGNTTYGWYTIESANRIRGNS